MDQRNTLSLADLVAVTQSDSDVDGRVNVQFSSALPVTTGLEELAPLGDRIVKA